LQSLLPASADSCVNTNKSWRCIANNCIIPLHSDISSLNNCGVGEKVDLSLYPTAFYEPEYNDSLWSFANENTGIKQVQISSLIQLLPLQNIKIQRLATVSKAINISTLPPRYPSSAASIFIPTNSEVKILFDQNFITTAYLSLIFSAGKGANIKLKYSESLYVDDPLLHGSFAQKGNRNEFDAKYFVGYTDEILTDGNPNKTWTSVSFRTFRYIQMTVVTHDEPLIINDFMAYATGFPFVPKASFLSENTVMSAILTAGWHTLKACSHDTYYGSPYYEQITNLNSARVLALAALFNTADTRLTKQVLKATASLQTTDGYLDLRLPAFQNQVDISQSLSWLGMLADLYSYSSDSLFVKSMLPVAHRIHAFFQKSIESDLKLPGCNFADFTKEWKNGVAPSDSSGASASAFFSMYYLYIVNQYINIEKELGNKALAETFSLFSDKLQHAIIKKYWNENRGLFANESTQKTYSQQVNTFAILAGLHVDSAFMHKIMNDSNLIQNSIYFKFYEHQALVKVGLSNEYLNHLKYWQDQLKQGLTTWAEQPEPTRSDCYGWGVSPNIEFYRIVLGVNSSRPWFNTIRIEPHLGDLKQVSGVVPHYKGDISVKYHYFKKKKCWDIAIVLPKGLKGEFVWKEKSYPLTDSITKWSYLEKNGQLVETAE